MRRWTGVSAWVLFLLLMVLLPAQARWQGRGGDTPGAFDFYVLALSWSPGWCATGGEQRGSGQCRLGSGNGFVLHGLWPQYARGFPSNCSRVERSPTPAAMQIARAIYPEEGLARYEWRKHGTCSGLDPAGYFSAAASAVAKVAIPPALRAPRGDTAAAPIEIERAFAEANPGLRPDMMAVSCRSGLLQEVRICLSRDLRQFVSCGEVDRKGCRSRNVTIPAVH
jgi:ribonuclease T2